MELLRRLDDSEVYDEHAWHQKAAGMGLHFTEKEILDYYIKGHK